MSRGAGVPGVDDLIAARGFATAFFELADKDPLPSNPKERGTKWFERRMQALGTKFGVHCQNYSSARPGEWMKVDHVFVAQDSYVNFPLVAVEHENGDISSRAKGGRIPPGDARGAYIEWACWKAIAMRSRLAVLVAYPYEKDKNAVLDLLAKIVDGARLTYGGLPSVLFLLGWWPRKPGAGARQLFYPYTATYDGTKVLTTPLSL